MKQFEYKVLAKGMPLALNDRRAADLSQAFERELNELGAQGWEFVQWENTMLIFKRELN